MEVAYISGYLMKYKGKYRLKANIDKNTNDFPRDENGNLETDDIYVKCQHGNQVYHYGRSTLVAYIPSLGRGHNILRGLAEELLNIKAEDKVPYEELYKLLENDKTVFDIVENDKEIEFKFDAKNIELIAKYLKPSTAGSSISPFSTKNLPRSDYIIPTEDLKEYKKITYQISKDNLLVISKLTNRFLVDILSKSKQYKTIDIRADMKKKMLRGKEYIHSIGYWDEYVKFLRDNLKGEENIDKKI